MLSTAAKKRLWETLFTPPEAEPMEVYALLDGASVRQLPDYFEEEDMRHAPLVPLTSEEPEEVTRAAYLALLQRDSPALEWLAADGWGRNWGIMIACPQGTEFETLLEHLRELAQVRLPDGRIVFFRFYDPRVWRPFATTCDAQQLQHLFKLPVTYACEGEDGESLVLDRMKNGAPERQNLLLDELAAGRPRPGAAQPR